MEPDKCDNPECFRWHGLWWLINPHGVDVGFEFKSIDRILFWVVSRYGVGVVEVGNDGENSNEPDASLGYLLNKP